MIVPPKPAARPGRVSLWRYFRLFRQDILSAQPAHLYNALMAEFRTPFFRSFLCNDPELVACVLKNRPGDFPKSDRVRAGLAPLLGNSVFVTNGEIWARQRRIIDPAFEGGKLRASFPAMWAAATASVLRLRSNNVAQDIDIETETSHAAADAIFRTLFSIPIEDATARAVFNAFRDHQRTAPVATLAALMPLPRWLPRPWRRNTRTTARQIRHLIGEMTAHRAQQIAEGTAPPDLATRIMTTEDPQTGQRFDTAEMVDQVAIFFLAGHETSASALAWSLYLLALAPAWQERVALEAAALDRAPGELSVLSELRISRAVFREALRLYPPVPMFVREATRPETFRKRPVCPGDQIIVSPWHLHRHARIWTNPDAFDPERWLENRDPEAERTAYLPFSTGPRVCPGAGFAMAEGTLMLSMIARNFILEPVAGRAPVPIAHLTVRARDGIWLRLRPRDPGQRP